MSFSQANEETGRRSKNNKACLIALDIADSDNLFTFMNPCVLSLKTPIGVHFIIYKKRAKAVKG